MPFIRVVCGTQVNSAFEASPVETSERAPEHEDLATSSIKTAVRVEAESGPNNKNYRCRNKLKTPVATQKCEGVRVKTTKPPNYTKRYNRNAP